MTFTWLVLPLLVGCAPDLRDGRDLDDPNRPPPEPGDAVLEDLGDGSWLLLVDASHPEVPILLDLDDQVTTRDAATGDLSFLRFEISVAEGASLLMLEGVDYDEELDLSEETFYEGLDAGYFLARWYDYDISTHYLSPADVLYVVRTSEGSEFKMQFQSYYADAGTSATVSLLVTDITKESTP